MKETLPFEEPAPSSLRERQDLTSTASAPANEARTVRRGRAKRIIDFLSSRNFLAILFVVVVPFWASSRMGAILQMVRHPALMNSVEMFLGASAAPIALFPWYYDENARKAFLAKKDPFAEWESGDEQKAVYVHIPPWEPGLSIPLRVLRKIFGTPVSLVTLVSCQLGLDIIVLMLIGALCFRIGGPIGAAVGLYTYANWTEAASASTYPFYYYWPVPFSVGLVAISALLHDSTRKRIWPCLALVAGLWVGTWCWFRGTAVTLIPAAPLIVAASLSSKRKSAYGASLVVAGTLVALAPSALHNWSISRSVLPRGQIWHDMYVGIGTRENPYGIIHRDEYAADLVKRKYGAEFHGAGYEEALRQEYFSVLRRDPRLLIRNFTLNFRDSMLGWSFRPAPGGVQGGFWLGALSGLLILALRRDRDFIVLGSACVIWLVQCATLSIVKQPQAGYLWETLGISVLCGAAGFGAGAELLVAFGARLVVAEKYLRI